MNYLKIFDDQQLLLIHKYANVFINSNKCNKLFLQQLFMVATVDFDNVENPNMSQKIINKGDYYIEIRKYSGDVSSLTIYHIETLNIFEILIMDHETKIIKCMMYCQ